MPSTAGGARDCRPAPWHGRTTSSFGATAQPRRGGKSARFAMGQHGMTFLPAPTYVLARAAWIPMLVIWHADGRFTRLAVHPAWPRDEHRLHQRRQPIG